MSEEETVNEEVVTEETVEETQPQKIDLIEEQLRNLQAQLGQLATSLTPKEEKKSGLTQEQLNQMAMNPAAAAQFIQHQIETGTKDALTKVQMEAQKTNWDNKAYADYPALNTDKKFQNAVIAQMNEFKNTGEYANNHPMLIFRAAQFVAGKMAGATTKNTNQRTNLVTSEAPRTGTSRTMGAKVFTVSEDDPRIKMGEMLGLKKDPKKWDRFKKEVEASGPRKEPERRKGRTFG